MSEPQKSKMFRDSVTFNKAVLRNGSAVHGTHVVLMRTPQTSETLRQRGPGVPVDVLPSSVVQTGSSSQNWGSFI